jgi:transcriptional regulator with XRE-family HTH domain
VVAAVELGDEAKRPGTRQYLASELRRARDLAGLSGRELAQRVGISQSKVSRIESGTTVPTAPEVAAWSEAVAASPETRQLLTTLTESVFTEVDTWRSALAGRAHMQDDVMQLEGRSERVLSFQPSLVPGLLQTAEYARRVFALFQPPYAENDLAAALATRLDRQLAIFDEKKEFCFLITEAALRWRPGPVSQLRAQVDRISSLSTLSNIRIGLIPSGVPALTSIAHSFVIFELGDAELRAASDGPGNIVTVEAIHANLTINDPESVALYRARWSLLSQMAIYGDEARAFLAGLSLSIERAQP